MAYNGWKNWETWNVALWIQNEEGLYHLARQCKDYAEFRAHMLDCGCAETQDGAKWDASALDIRALNRMIRDL